MTELTSALSAWESVYVIVGSSGGALIGLQFVVITLIADRRHPTTTGSLGAFATPTVVHLTGALTVSAIMSAPWVARPAPRRHSQRVGYGHAYRRFGIHGRPDEQRLATGNGP